MRQLSVTTPRDFSAPIILSVFIPIWLLKVAPIEGFSISQWGLPLVIGAFVAFRTWLEVVRGRRVVVIDGQSGEVSVHTTSLFLREETMSFALSGFGSVRSYITPGKFPMNVVELVTNEGGESLCLAAYNPASDKRRWLTPNEIESAKAQDLRARVSELAGLRDDGFLGSRWVGKQLDG